MNRLRAYREIEQINQEELGAIFDLSAPMISSIESGRREFSGDLTRIGYSPERFMLPNMSEPLHRQRASTKASAQKRAKELLRLGGEVFTALQTATSGTPKTAIERIEPPETLQELEEFTTDLRAVLGIEESGPINNLTQAIERAGICVISVAGLTGIAGLSSWVEGTPVIGVAPQIPGDRFRFTLSHEIGHLLMHRRKNDYVESEANRFAGAFLFPRTDFEAAIGVRPNLQDFIALKNTWGVAVSSLVMRAHELEIVDDARYRALQIQMSKWRKAEPGWFAPAYGTLLNRLIEVNGGITKVSANLGINKKHVRELVNWNPLRLV